MRFAAGIFGLVAALVTLAGCTAGVPTALPGSGPLVTITAHGGMCPAAECATTTYLERDGRVHTAAKPPNDVGRVSADQVAAIAAAIGSTDFDAMRAHPFTGTCPMAFDGQELVFEFAVAGGTQRIASCETAIDWGSPLFVALAAALGPWVPLPTT